MPDYDFSGQDPFLSEVRGVVSARERGLDPQEHAKYVEMPRFTVVETTAYHPVSGELVIADARYHRFLESHEQPFVRHTQVGSEWEPLDTGWLKGDVSLVVIQNQEGKSFRCHPSEAEKKAVAERVLRVALRGGADEQPVPFLQIRPGESARFEPADARALVLCSQRGAARYTLTALPK